MSETGTESTFRSEPPPADAHSTASPSPSLADRPGLTTIVDILPRERSFESDVILKPFGSRILEKLKRGPVINVFVGHRPQIALIMSHFPAALLAEFAPALADSLKNLTEKSRSIVVLQDLDTAAVAWCLRLAFAGFKLPETKDHSLMAKFHVEVLLNRLRVLLVLGQRSFVVRMLTGIIHDAILAKKVPASHLAWIFADPAPYHVRRFADRLVAHICDAVLSGALTSPLVGALRIPYFRHGMRAEINAKCVEIERHFFEDHSPLTRFQTACVFEFTEHNDAPVRKTIARGLLWLIRQGYTLDNECFVQTRQEYPELGDLMKKVDAIWQRHGCLQPRAEENDMQLHHYREHLKKHQTFSYERKFSPLGNRDSMNAQRALKEKVPGLVPVQHPGGRTRRVTFALEQAQDHKQVMGAEDEVVGECPSAETVVSLETDRSEDHLWQTDLLDAPSSSEPASPKHHKIVVRLPPIDA